MPLRSGDLEFEELALDKAQNKAGFASAHVPEKNLHEPPSSDQHQNESENQPAKRVGRGNGEGGERENQPAWR